MDENIIKIMQSESPLDWEKCEKIANENGLKTRAVVASAVRQGIEYNKKARVGKTGKPAINKENLVGQIAEKFGISIEELDGLDKANKSALEAILNS